VVGWEVTVGGNGDGWLYFFFPLWMGGWDGNLVIMDYDKIWCWVGKNLEFVSRHPYLYFLD